MVSLNMVIEQIGNMSNSAGSIIIFPGNLIVPHISLIQLISLKENIISIIVFVAVINAISRKHRIMGFR